VNIKANKVCKIAMNVFGKILSKMWDIVIAIYSTGMI
jgi:hypothetical protein